MRSNLNAIRAGTAAVFIVFALYKNELEMYLVALIILSTIETKKE